MALAATIVWEVRTAGSDTNGGGFKPGASGTDWSQQDAAQYSVTDGVTAGSTTITSLTANFGTDVVGNLIYVAGGTGTLAGVWREITARASATSITVDAATGLGASTGVTLKIGGALASPGNAGFSKVLGNDVWIKAGTYTIASATPNVATGIVSDTTGGTGGTNISRWEGYQTTRGDKGTKPILLASGISGATLFASSGSAVVVDNIVCDGATLGTMTGFSLTGNRAAAIRCKAQNCTTNGINISNNDGVLYRCEATGCSGTAAFNIATNASVARCEAYANTIHGFLAGSGALAPAFVGCIASANSGTTDGFQIGGRNAFISGCVAYNNGRHGFNITGSGSFIVENCIAEGNVAGTAYGFTSTTGVTQGAELFNCAGFNNTTGNVNATNLPNNTSFVTGSATFFTNAGSGDFSLTSVASGSAARGAGYPGIMPRGISTGHIDIGAIQHLDAGGTGIFFL